MSLTCSLVYTGNKDNYTNVDDFKSANYICSDNKIHIRFRDYNEPQRIYGFEGKLTYLITYLMNYSYLPTIVKKYDYNTLIKDFSSISDLNSIVLCIKLITHDDKLKGFKLAKNYRKDDSKRKDFGNVDINCFPSNIDSEGIDKVGSLETFRSYFKNIGLDEYLFNDAISIIIHEDKEIKPNKFEKKALRKSKEIDSSDFVALW